MKIKKIFDDALSYVMATPYRQVFFGAVLIAIACGIASIWAGIVALRIAIACFGAAMLCSMVDTMQTRVAFNEQIRAMQEEHYKKYLDAGTESMAEIPVAFSPEEYNYIKKQRRNFVFSIMVKAVLLLTILTSFFA